MLLLTRADGSGNMLPIIAGDYAVNLEHSSAGISAFGGVGFSDAQCKDTVPDEQGDMTAGP